MHRSVLSILASALTILACSGSNEPEPALVSIVVQVDTISATIDSSGTDHELQYSIPVEVRNDGDVQFSAAACIWGMEEQVGDKWEEVWSPACVGTKHPVILGVGETTSFSLAVAARIPGTGSLDWRGSEISGGTYRVRVGLFLDGATMLRTAASTSFVLIW